MADATKQPVTSKDGARRPKASVTERTARTSAGGHSPKPPAGAKGSEERRRRRRIKRMVVNILQGVCFVTALALFIMLIVHIVQNFNPEIPAQADDLTAEDVDLVSYEESLAANDFQAAVDDFPLDENYSTDNGAVNALDDEGISDMSSFSEGYQDELMSGESASFADMTEQDSWDDASDGYDSAATASSEPAQEEHITDTSSFGGEVHDAVATDGQIISADVSLPDLSDDALSTADNADTAAISPTSASEPVTITITATGDATLGFSTNNGGYSNFKQAMDSFGCEYFLQNFKEYFSEDDFTLVNLEGPLTASTDKRPNRPFNFRGEPDYVGILTSASVEVCNLGNNHAYDYKEQGFTDTCQILDDNGIGYCGFTKEYFAQCKGHTVGFVGFNTWDHKVDDMIDEVSAAKQKCDLLIVSAHWGDEGDGTFSNETKKLGQAFVDAGADLVIGNHPHLPGAVMNYKGKYIIQVLGNFCFGGNDRPGQAVRRTAVFRQSFVLAPDGSVSDGGIDIVPGFISGHSEYNDFQPFIADAEDGLDILKGMYRASKGAFQPMEVLWLDDSYVYEQGILENPRAAATPEAAQDADTIEAMPETSEPSADTNIL